MPPYNIWDQFWLKLDGISEDGGIPRDLKLTYKWPLKRPYNKDLLLRILNWKWDYILITHGKDVSENAKVYLIQKLDFLINN